MRTQRRRRLYPPEYVSIETLAYRLDCSVEVIERQVRDGVLPSPRLIGGLRRWRFSDVEIAIEGQASSDGRSAVAANGVVYGEGDPFLDGIEQVDS